MITDLPKFEVDDWVTFEIAPKYKGNVPRWCDNYDLGYTDINAEGIITEISTKDIILDALFPDGVVIPLSFPNTTNKHYFHRQWLLPGYLKISEKELQKQPQCECGHGNESGIHYLFCPRREWMMNQHVI